jgi:hypothetical protein
MYAADYFRGMKGSETYFHIAQILSPVKQGL